MSNIHLIRNLIRILGKNIGVLEKTEIKCCDISVGQCHAILEIGLAKEISLIDLAGILNLDKSTMSRTISTLVDEGLVERSTDKYNRRYIKIALTEKGNNAFERISLILERYFKSIFDTIPQEKQEQVKDSIELLITALEKNPCC